MSLGSGLASTVVNIDSTVRGIGSSLSTLATAGVAPLTNVAAAIARLAGRPGQSFSNDPYANLIAGVTSGLASFGILPLVMALQGEKKAYDPLKEIKILQRELQKNRPNSQAFRNAEAEFRRKRLGLLKTPEEFDFRDARDSARIGLHHRIFSNLTARDVLRNLDPRTVQPALKTKPRFGFVPAGTRSKNLNLQQKLQRLSSAQPLPPISQKRKIFSAGEIANYYDAQLQAVENELIERGPASRGRRNWDQIYRRNLFNADQKKAAINAELVRSSLPDDFLSKAQPMTVAPTTEVKQVSITGVPTPTNGGGGLLGGLGGFLEDLTGAIGGGIDVYRQIEQIRNPVPAASQPGGPMPVTAVFPAPTMGPISAGLLPTFGPAGPVIGGALGGAALGAMFNGGGGAPTSAFRTTAAGNQVAQAFVATRDNGRAEWFIPAGKPTSWSKASIKRRRRCSPR